MNLDNNYMIFKDEYNKYKIGISHKNMEGKTEYANFPVKFKKDVSLENKTKIKIKKYWLDFYNWEYQEKKGTTFYIFINDFEIIDEPAKKVANSGKKNETNPFEEFGQQFEVGQQVEIDMENDLPF